MEEDGELFYFTSAPEVEEYSSKSSLVIRVSPEKKSSQKKYMYGRLHEEFGVSYAELHVPPLHVMAMCQLFNAHKGPDKLMTWEEVNRPRSKHHLVSSFLD